MTKEISVPPEVKKFRVRKAAAKTAAAIVFMSVAPPIAYAGIDHSYDLMRERNTQLQEQGIIQPTPDEYHKAEKIDLRCQKKAQDKVFIAKEKPRCDQAQRKIFEYKAYNTAGLEIPLMLGSVALVCAAGMVGWNTFISKEPK